MKKTCFLLLTILTFSCQSPTQESSNSEPVTVVIKQFEDTVLKATLSEIQIEGNVLRGKLQLTNKSAHKTTLQLKDMIFQCQSDFGEPIKDEVAMAEAQENLKKVLEQDFKPGDMEHMKKRMKARRDVFLLQAAYGILMNDLRLEGNQQVTKEVLLQFQGDVSLEHLEIFYKGEYKRLLNI